MDNSKPANGFTVYWRIENFNYEPDNDFLVESPLFEIESLNSEWQIDVGRGKYNINAYLSKMSNFRGLTVSYSMSILTSSGWTTLFKDSERTFRVSDYRGCKKLFSLAELKEKEWFYLPNGSLTISFHINKHRRVDSKTSQCLMISRLINKNNLHNRPTQFFSSLKPSDLLSFPSSYNIQCADVPPSDQKSKILETKLIQTDTTNVDFKNTDDLIKLFKEKDFSFVTLRTPSGNFTVHKAVLCAKSSVFNAMFEMKMRENDCNIIEIDDIDGETIGSLLKFLHFQPLGDLNVDNAMKLYYAADKYQIDLLKKECISALMTELAIENICDVFILADMHQDKDLMSGAQEYFYKNSKVILLSKQWKDLLLCHTELASNVLYKLAEKM